MQGGRAGGGAGVAISGPARFHLAPLPWQHPPPVLACTHPPKCGHGRSVRPATKQSGATVGQGSPPLSSPGLFVTSGCFRETAARQRASENLGLGCAVMGPRPERQARALDCPKTCIWLSMRRKEVKRCRKGAGCVANPVRRAPAGGAAVGSRAQGVPRLGAQAAWSLLGSRERLKHSLELTSGIPFQQLIDICPWIGRLSTPCHARHGVDKPPVPNPPVDKPHVAPLSCVTWDLSTRCHALVMA